LTQIAERIRHLAAIQEEHLLLEILNGPVKAYFDSENFEKETLEEQIEESLQKLRGEYKQTQKYLSQAFQDVIQMVNGLQDLSEAQIPD
jgi:ATP-dependent Clp protease ATP-binding subunit ClpA